MAARVNLDPAQYIESFGRLGSYVAVARAFGVNESTVRRAIRAAKAVEPLTAAGYQITGAERTPEQAWRAHVGAFEHKVGRQVAKLGSTLRRTGPFVIFHATDEHIDDDASALNLLEADIQASHEMGAIMCHGGDLLNNWPLAGRLAKQWSEQSCTLPDALLRAQHFISIFRPEVWVDGNHEEMNPYLVNLFDQWLPKGIVRDYWRADFSVSVPGGRDFRVALSHKFQKGGSWFHANHGHIREMLESDERDLYIDGHFHQAGVMQHYLPERDHHALLVASAGYKLIDKYATRISRGGKMPRILGRAHWIVVDPFTDGPMAQAFTDPALAEAYLGSLQNLRAA